MVDGRKVEWFTLVWNVEKYIAVGVPREERREMTNDSSNVRWYNKEKKRKKQNKIKIYREHAYSSGVFILFVQRLHIRDVYMCERNQNPLVIYGRVIMLYYSNVSVVGDIHCD